MEGGGVGVTTHRIDCISVASEWRYILMMMLVNVGVKLAHVEKAMKPIVDGIVYEKPCHRNSKRIKKCGLG